MTVRRTALSLLTRWENENQFINLSLGGVADSLPASDRRFLTALVYGTVEQRIRLDYIIGRLTKRSDLRPGTRNILRLGLYELLWMHTPPYAVLNETVKLTDHAGEAGFVNAVLRAAQRDPAAAMALPPREKNPVRYLSLACSVPPDTVRLLRDVLDSEAEAEAYLTAVNSHPPMTVTVNTTKITRADYLLALSKAGIAAQPHPLANRSVRICADLPADHLPGFSEGWFFVQDAASCISTEVLDPQPGDTVWDLCSAPGGKAFGAMIAMRGEGRVLASDLHPSKLSLIRTGADRLGLAVTVFAHDATLPPPEEIPLCDRVICDVPCSGLGVLGKKPDLRYRTRDSWERLPALQAAIFSQAAKAVRRGGILLYSTCTVNPQENDAQISAFLAAHPEFAPVPFTVGPLSAPGGTLTLYPHRDETDGFFIAKLKRSEM